MILVLFQAREDLGNLHRSVVALENFDNGGCQGARCGTGAGLPGQRGTADGASLTDLARTRGTTSTAGGLGHFKKLAGHHFGGGREF